MDSSINFEINGPNFIVPSDIRRMLEMSGTRRYKVTMTPIYGERTRRQNAYFHMIIGRIATASGAGSDMIKESVKELAVTMGYPPKTDDHGRPVLTSKGEFVPLPSHEANSREMGILIEAALYFATEQGVEIDPAMHILYGNGLS